MAGGEIIFETIQIGQSQKISAIDVASGTEVSLIVPSNTDPSYARDLAARKLAKRLKRERKKPGGHGILL